jgi:hypothetical protein
MARKEHSSELLAQQVFEWIESSAKKLAGAMYEGDAAPGAAVLTKDEQLSYYERLLYTPEGLPNPEGRMQFQSLIGPAERTLVVNALIKRKQERLKGSRQPEEPAYEEAYRG